MQEQEQEAVGRVLHKPAVLLIPASASPDSCAMVESICRLSWPQESVQVLQHRVNHGNMPFPSPPYSAALPVIPRLEPISPSCIHHQYQQPPYSAALPVIPRLEPISPSCIHHQYQQPPYSAALPVIPRLEPISPSCIHHQYQQPLHSADAQQHNGNWWGNVRGNSGPWSAPATHATCIDVYKESSSDNETLNAMPTRLKVRVACTCPNCVNGVNNIKNQDGTSKKKKQHVCHYPGCDKVYSKTSHLQAHLRWHTGERPFMCDWSLCGKRFTRSKDLQRHRRVHTRERKYICKKCPKRFMRSDHLSKHVKTHLKNKNKLNMGKTALDSPGSVSSSNSSSSDISSIKCGMVDEILPVDNVATIVVHAIPELQ